MCRSRITLVLLGAAAVGVLGCSSAGKPASPRNEPLVRSPAPAIDLVIPHTPRFAPPPRPEVMNFDLATATATAAETDGSRGWDRPRYTPATTVAPAASAPASPAARAPAASRTPTVQRGR